MTYSVGGPRESVPATPAKISQAPLSMRKHEGRIVNRLPKNPVIHEVFAGAVKKTPQDSPDLNNRSVCKEEKILAKSIQAQIKKTSEQRKLSFLAKAIETTVDRTGRNFILQNMGGSQNPVSRLQEEFMIPKKNLENYTVKYKTKNDALNGVKTQFQKGMNHNSLIMRSKINEVKQKYQKIIDRTPEKKNELETEMENEVNNLEKVSKEQFETAVTIFKNINNEINRVRTPNAVFSKSLTALDDLMETYKEDFKMDVSYMDVTRKFLEKESFTLDLQGVSVQYEKDAMLANLRLMQISAEKESPTILSAIEKVKASPGFYVSSDIVNSFKGVDPEKVKSGLIEYVSYTETLAKNQFSKEADGILIKEGKVFTMDKPGFAFKTGVENQKELLAAKLNEIMQFNHFLLHKVELTFKKAVLGKTRSPTGIASRWLEGGQPIDRASWEKYNNVKMQIAQKTFKGEDTTDERAELETLKEQVLAQDGGPRSERLSLQKEIKENLSEGKNVDTLEKKLAELDRTIQEMKPLGVMNQARMNLRLQSYDSHPGQFMFVDGQAWGFDEARFLAPGLAYTRDTQDETRTYVTFRAGILDHPDCGKPIPREIIEEILQQDVESQRKALDESGLIGEESFFNRQLAVKEQIFRDLDVVNFKNDNVQLQNICVRCGVEFNANNIDTVKEELKQVLSQELTKIKESCFQKIHPKAAKECIQRAKLEKEYVKKCQKEGNAPTIKGMRDFVYPELKTFFTVLERISPNPSDMIGLTIEGGASRLNPWENIISKAKNLGMLSEEEEGELIKDLAAIRQNKSFESQELSLTMDM